MKKLLMVGAMVLTGTLAITGCSSVSKTYKTLNELTQVNYASISLSVTATLDGETLTGTYTTKSASNGYSVEYSFEKLNTFEVDNGSITVPDEYKSTYSGSFTYNSATGETTDQQGTPADFEAGLLTAAGLKFAAENFGNVESKSNLFKASVTNISGFCGKAISASNMNLEVKYSKKNIETMRITFQANGGAQVVMFYSFTL